MDGLSGAASVVGVVSLAVQLGHSIKKLCDFWDSVKEAPDDVHAITTDLSLLSSVLAEMAFEEQHCGPDHTLNRVLEACQGTVNKLTQITNDMEPGFASTSLRIRKWTAFRAGLKGERIQKVQKVLDGLKMTLMLAQQSHHRRLDRIRFQSQQLDLTTIAKHLSSLHIEQLSTTVSTITNSPSVFDDHTNALRGQASQICRTIRNPVHRVGFGIGSNIAVQELATDLPNDQSTSPWPMPNTETDHPNHACRAETPHQSRQQKSMREVPSIRYYFKQTLLGAVTTTTRTRSFGPRFVDDECLNSEDHQYENETSFRILPAQWLLKLGFNYAYNLSTFDSSTQGWQWCIKPINLVPDDASIFKFCDQGDIERVRDLISNNVASVRDVDSEGRTALHFAVQSHSPELCNFLIEAGADKNARTFHPLMPMSPLLGIRKCSITENGLVNAIDTCRIFEDSFDFWDERGDGWYLVRTNDLTKSEASDRFYSWIIQSSSSDIKANYKVKYFWSVFTWSVSLESNAIDLLWSLGSPRILDELEELLSEPPLFFYISGRQWIHVNTLLTWGVDPYHVQSSGSYSPVPESPLSLAMYSPWTFWGFRNVLRKMYPNVEDIARQELKEGRPLFDAGWHMETLSALLELECEPNAEPERPYRLYRCGSCHDMTRVGVQLFWQVTLESIKIGTYRQRFLSDTQDEHPLSKRSHPKISNQDSLINATDGSDLSPERTLQEDEAALPDGDSSTREDDTSSTTPDREEVWCINCWLHYKKTGHRQGPDTMEMQPYDGDDSSEDDFSHFLFNT